MLSQYTAHIDYNTVTPSQEKQQSSPAPILYHLQRLLSEDLIVGYDLYCNMYNESPLHMQTLFTYYIPQWDSTLVQWPPSNNSHTFGRVDQDKHLPRLVAEAIVQVGHERL